MEQAVLGDERPVEVGRDQLDVCGKALRKLYRTRVDPETIGEVPESRLASL
jgi:hypothetical protein